MTTPPPIQPTPAAIPVPAPAPIQPDPALQTQNEPMQVPQVTSKVNGREFTPLPLCKSLGSAFWNWKAHPAKKTFVGVFWAVAIAVAFVFDAAFLLIRATYWALEENYLSPPNQNGREFVVCLGAKSLGGALANWKTNIVIKVLVGIPVVPLAIGIAVIEGLALQWIRRVYNYFEPPEAPPKPEEKKETPKPAAESDKTKPDGTKPPDAPAKRISPNFFLNPVEYYQLSQQTALAGGSAQPLTPEDPSEASSAAAAQQTTSLPLPTLDPAAIQPNQTPNLSTRSRTPAQPHNWPRIALGAAKVAALGVGGYYLGIGGMVKWVWNATVAPVWDNVVAPCVAPLAIGFPALKALWNQPNLRAPLALGSIAVASASIYREGVPKTFTDSLSVLRYMGQAHQVAPPEAGAILQGKGIPGALGAAALSAAGVHYLGAEATMNHGLSALSALSLQRNPLVKHTFQSVKEGLSQAARSAWNNKILTGIATLGALAIGYTVGPSVLPTIASSIWSNLPYIHMTAQALSQHQAQPEAGTDALSSEAEADAVAPEDLALIEHLGSLPGEEERSAYLTDRPEEAARLASMAARAARMAQAANS